MMASSVQSAFYVTTVILKIIQLVSANNVSTVDFQNSSITQDISGAAPNTTAITGDCSDNELLCVIRANITLQTGMKLPINIDCLALNETDTGQPDVSYGSELSDLFLNRFKNIQKVSMDGRCSNATTFGLEHLPDVNSSLQVAMFQNFHFDYVTGNLFRSIASVRELFFENNKFKKISRDAFKATGLIDMIVLQQNQIERIENAAFDNLKNLRTLSINEPCLSIEEEEFFQNMHCEHLKLSTKMINAKVLEKLPGELQELQVTNMSFADVQVVNPGNLTNLLIFDNTISNLIVVDNSQLISINLSNNSLEDFRLVNCSKVESLDLSYNVLATLRNDSFMNAQQLKFVYLQNNRLKTLSMDVFHASIATMIKIDLTGNSLRSIELPADFNPNPEVNIIMNKNQWDCRWVLDIARKRPDLFQHFRYEKFVSRINVYGLECVTFPSSDSQEEDAKAASLWKQSIELPKPPVDSSTLSVRNFRSLMLHGLIIVICLVAILAMTSYAWSKWRQSGHLPFYTSLKRSHWTPDRFDVIRQLPRDTNSPGYEIPLQYFDTNPSMEHVELLDTIGNFEPIEPMPLDQIPEPVVIYEEIKDTK